MKLSTFCSVVVILASCTVPASAQVLSDFNSDLQGWDCPSSGPPGTGTAGCPHSGEICWGCPAGTCGPCGPLACEDLPCSSNADACLDYCSRGDGNPGGYLRFRDTCQGRPYLSAPATFLGDWSDRDGCGAIRFDHRVFEANTEDVIGAGNFTIILEGTGGVTFTWLGPAVTFDTLPPPACDKRVGNDWRTVVAPLDQAEWSTDGTASWQDLLDNVTNLWIRAELVGQQYNPDHEGFDNIELVDGCCTGVDLTCPVTGVDPPDGDDQEVIDYDVMDDDFHMGQANNALTLTGTTTADPRHLCLDGDIKKTLDIVDLDAPGLSIRAVKVAKETLVVNSVFRELIVEASMARTVTIIDSVIDRLRVGHDLKGIELVNSTIGELVVGHDVMGGGFDLTSSVIELACVGHAIQGPSCPIGLVDSTIEWINVACP